jgi:hypothetical protein
MAFWRRIRLAKRPAVGIFSGKREGIMATSTNIRLVKIGDDHWIHTAIGNMELERQGPFVDETEAIAAARRIAGVCQAIFRSGVVVAPMPVRRRV